MAGGPTDVDIQEPLPALQPVFDALAAHLTLDELVVLARPLGDEQAPLEVLLRVGPPRVITAEFALPPEVVGAPRAGDVVTVDPAPPQVRGLVAPIDLVWIAGGEVLAVAAPAQPPPFEGARARLAWSVGQLIERKLRRARIEWQLTERLAEVERLRAVEVRLSAIVEHARIGILSVDRDRSIASWNQAAQQLFGWSAEEVLGRPMTILDPLDPDATPVQLPSTSDPDPAATRAYLETKRRHRDGYDVEVGVSLAPIVDPDGQRIGTSAFYLDLSERNAAVRDAAESKAQLEMLAQHALDVVFRVRLDPQVTLEYVSPSASNVYGFDPAMLYADPGLIPRNVHVDDRHTLVINGAEVGPVTVRFRFRRGDGRWRWLEERRSPIVVDGETVAFSGIGRDVTEEVRAADALRTALERERHASEELRQVDTMKSAFLSAVSHELRTPLTSVVGFAETLDRVGDLRGAAAKALRPLMENARRLERLIDDLLDLDRLSEGAVTPRIEPTDLHELVGRVVERYRQHGRAITCDAGEVVVHADRVMLDRAVDNLVRNATRHTPSESSIWIRAYREGVDAIVEVEDDGPGIAAGDRDRILEPFQQGTAATGSASPGTGIGLSLVERFVAAHGGAVEVGDRPGGGARFTVRVPVDPRAAATVEDTSSEGTPE